MREDKRSPGGVELTLDGLHVVSGADGFPITPKEHSSTFLLDNRHLWLRSRKQHVVLRVRHHVVRAIRDYRDVITSYSIHYTKLYETKSG